MGAAKPFKIETMPEFPRKKDAKAFFKAILARYADEERVDEEDSAHLRALLKHHTEYELKVGVGISHFKVDINREYDQTTRSFWVIRVDGSIDDVSYLHCITPKKS